MHARHERRDLDERHLSRYVPRMQKWSMTGVVAGLLGAGCAASEADDGTDDGPGDSTGAAASTRSDRRDR